MKHVKSSQGLRILVTDGQELAGIGATRSLGRAGHRVTVAWTEGEVQPAAVWSRHCAEAVATPDPWREHPAYGRWLAGELASGQYDAVLPITEAATVALASLRFALERPPLLLLPDDRALRYTLSKFEATTRALEEGVTCPRTVFMEPGPLDALRERLATLRFPAIVKTDNYFSPSGAYHKGRSQVAANPDVALALAREAWRRPTRVIVQELIPGEGAGAFFLRYGGRFHLEFTHRRLHEVPWTGGYSSLRESCRDEALLAAGRRLLEAIDYEGVAMVEFRRAPDGRLYFLEINGRLWGSLALALHAGADFPRALLDCTVAAAAHRDGKARRKRRPAPSPALPTWREGVRCRNVFPGELYYLVSVLKAHPAPGVPTPPSRIRTLAEFVGLSFNPTIRHDFFWWSDPLPGFVQAWHTLAEFGGLLMEKLLRPWVERRDQRLLAGLRLAHARRASWPRYFPRPLHRILFICYGNICRSPFAEFYWRDRLARLGRTGPEVISAGYYPEFGRSSPGWICDLAADWGLDLSAHRSRLITWREVEAADAIFVMDRHNWREFLAHYPQAADRTYLLGLFADDGETEIQDPFMLGPERSRPCYQHLVRALDGLLDRVRRDEQAVELGDDRPAHAPV